MDIPLEWSCNLLKIFKKMRVNGTLISKKFPGAPSARDTIYLPIYIYYLGPGPYYLSISYNTYK